MAAIRAALVLLLLAVVATTLATTASATASLSSYPLNPSWYDPAGVLVHLQKLEAIAGDHGGSRAVFLGYNDSVQYVLDQLAENTSYQVSLQHFSVDLPTYTDGTPFFRLEEPVAEELVLNTDFLGYNYGGSATISNLVQVVPGGCFLEDFADFRPGHIALLNRLSYCPEGQTCQDCSYRDKITNAGKSSASGILLYNPDDGLPMLGSTNQDVDVPVFGISSSLAAYFTETISAGQAVRVQMVSSTAVETHVTMNVIAESPGGYDDRVIVVGAHLDSVPAGPGINDNGSGSASILEIALQFESLGNPVNKVRFAWWSAEEWGLLGSEYYVASMSDAERSNIALNLNFDMLGSPNYERGVYDGRNGPDDVKEASGNIQTIFEKYFDSMNLTYLEKPFNGRSDYGPFIERGIPAGGLAAGAEEIKTPDLRDDFGGVANAALDTCYHLECDTFKNIHPDSIYELSSAAAYTLEYLAFEPDLPGFLNP